MHIEGACNRVPVIAETGIKSTVCGPGEPNLSCSQFILVQTVLDSDGSSIILRFFLHFEYG